MKKAIIALALLSVGCSKEKTDSPTLQSLGCQYEKQYSCCIVYTGKYSSSTKVDTVVFHANNTITETKYGISIDYPITVTAAGAYLIVTTNKDNNFVSLPLFDRIAKDTCYFSKSDKGIIFDVHESPNSLFQYSGYFL